MALPFHRNDHSRQAWKGHPDISTTSCASRDYFNSRVLHVSSSSSETVFWKMNVHSASLLASQDTIEYHFEATREHHFFTQGSWGRDSQLLFLQCRDSSSRWSLLLQRRILILTPSQMTPNSRYRCHHETCETEENVWLTQISHLGNRVCYPPVFIKNLTNSLVFVKCLFKIPLLHPPSPRHFDSMCCCW